MMDYKTGATPPPKKVILALTELDHIGLDRIKFMFMFFIDEAIDNLNLCPITLHRDWYAHDDTESTGSLSLENYRWWYNDCDLCHSDLSIRLSIIASHSFQRL